MQSNLLNFTLFLVLFITPSVAAGVGGRKLGSFQMPLGAPPSGTPTGATGSAHGPNWDYSWGWGSGPGSGWGYGSGSGRSPSGFGRGTGYGFGYGSGSGSGYGYGSGGGGARGSGYGFGMGSGSSGGGGAGYDNRSPSSASWGRIGTEQAGQGHSN